jgi:hypothetical protein
LPKIFPFRTKWRRTFFLSCFMQTIKNLAYWKKWFFFFIFISLNTWRGRRKLLNTFYFKI